MADIITPNIDPVLVTQGGDTWYEIGSTEVAKYAGAVSQTAVGYFYEQEARLEGGTHPRRWFFLVGPGDNGKTIGKVSLCVLPEGVETKAPDFVADCHTTGYQNRPAYPAYADEIEQLSEVIGIDLPPNMAGRPIEVAPAGQSPRP